MVRSTKQPGLSAIEVLGAGPGPLRGAWEGVRAMALGCTLSLPSLCVPRES
jgi:hypothetical protein